jgi:hypothetical protein
MLPLLWSACAPSLPPVTLPVAPGEPAPAGAAVVVVTPEVVWLDPSAVPGAVPDEPRQTDAWATADTAGMQLPGLAGAVDALPERDRAVVLAIDAAVPLDRVARVLVSLGQSVSGVALKADGGVVSYQFPTFCGSATDAASVQKLGLLLASAPTGPCLAPSVTQVDGGLRVELLPIGQDKPGCTVAVARPREPGATDWRDAVALPAGGACPSVAGTDAAALGALLDRTPALEQRCHTAFLAMRGTTPWGEVLPAYAALRSRHQAASLGLAGDAAPDCARGFVLP